MTGLFDHVYRHKCTETSVTSNIWYTAVRVHLESYNKYHGVLHVHVGLCTDKFWFDPAYFKTGSVWENIQSDNTCPT